MGSLRVSRDGRTALFIVVAGVVAALMLMIGLAGVPAWLVDSGTSRLA
jgi:hypothetical protein